VIKSEKNSFDYKNDILELEDGNPLSRIKLEENEVFELMTLVNKIIAKRV